MKKWIGLLIAAISLALMSPWVGAAQEEAEQEKPAQTQKQSQTQPQTEVLVTNEVLQQGTYSGVKEALGQIITSRQDWETLWKTHTNVLVPQPPLPEVDFETQAIVAIYAGEKRTSGYRIVLKDVAAQGTDLVITYRLTEPPADSFTLQVLSQPFLILRVQKPPGAIKLVKQ